MSNDPSKQPKNEPRMGMNMKKTKNMEKIADLYLKIVEWSEEDQCFVGRCPGLFIGGCHGADDVEVYRELRELVKAHIADMLNRATALPAPAAGKTYSGKFVVRLAPELHKKVALQAMARGESLNEFVSARLAEA